MVVEMPPTGMKMVMSMWEIGESNSAPPCVGCMLLGPAGVLDLPGVAGLRFPGPGVARRPLPELVPLLAPVHRDNFVPPGIVRGPLVLAGTLVPVPVY